MSPTVLLDVVIIALLVPTIVYAVILNRRLETLRRNRDDLAKMIAAFNEATVRAEAGIPKMRKAAQDAGDSLQASMEKAQTLRDDLAFMTERADSMANRLEGQLREARGAARPIVGVETAAAVSSFTDKAAVHASEQAVELPEPLGMDFGDKDTLEATPLSGLGTLTGEATGDSRVVGGITPAPTLLSALLNDDEDDDGQADERSEAERQLLRAIQSSR